jgi:hypothetical protein
MGTSWASSSRTVLGVEVLGLLADQQAEVRAVGGQGHAVAVVDRPARRRDQAVVELVAGRKLLVAPGLDQLQLGQPPAQGQQAGPGQAAHQERPAVEDPLPLVDLGKEDRRFAHRAASRGGVATGSSNVARQRDGVAAARKIMRVGGRELRLIRGHSGPARAAVNGLACARRTTFP